MSSFEELLKKQQAKKSAGVESSTVDVVFADELITLKFYEMPGTEWAALTSKHPADPEVNIDRLNGYSVMNVVKEAAPLSGVYVDGDEEVKLSVEQWELFFPELSFPGFSTICDTVWGLNHWNPVQRVAGLKKALIAASKAKQDSPVSSASASNVSTGGNRKQRLSTSTTKTIV